MLAVCVFGLDSVALLSIWRAVVYPLQSPAWEEVHTNKEFVFITHDVEI
jgi:hypothetical protein